MLKINVALCALEQKKSDMKKNLKNIHACSVLWRLPSSFHTSGVLFDPADLCVFERIVVPWTELSLHAYLWPTVPPPFCNLLVLAQTPTPPPMSLSCQLCHLVPEGEQEEAWLTEAGLARLFDDSLAADDQDQVSIFCVLGDHFNHFLLYDGVFCLL